MSRPSLAGTLPHNRLSENNMSIAPIKAFSEKAKADPALAETLKACQKIKELRALALEHGYEIEENSLYPPNEPQFTEDQLSERLIKALLRV